MRRLRFGGVLALPFATSCSSLRISTFACAFYAKDLRVNKTKENIKTYKYYIMYKNAKPTKKKFINQEIITHL